MTYRSTVMLGVAAGALMIGGPVRAQTIGYFLPKVAVSGSVKQRLEHCPTGLGDDLYPMIVTTMSVKPTYTPDQYVEVSAKSGFLAQRSVEVNLRPDGTLESINASSEGQGAKVLGAVVKIGAGIVGLRGAGSSLLNVAESQKLSSGKLNILTSPPPVPKPHLKCAKEISSKVTEMRDLRRNNSEFDNKIADGISLNEIEIAIMLLNKKRINDFQNELTIRGKTKNFEIYPLRGVENLNTNIINSQSITTLDYSMWFSNYNDVVSDAKSQIVGRDGFEFEVSAEKSIFDQMRKTGQEKLPKTSKNIVYLRGIPAIASLSVKGDTSATAKALNVETDFDIPQYSRYFTLPAGGGGIFGTREAKVKLSESGSPTLLSYGTKGAGADFSTLADSSLAAAASIRDSKTEALKRAIERRQAEKDLLDLIDPGSAADDD